MDQEVPKFFMLDEGTEDFYDFPDDWDEDEEEEIEEDVDLKKLLVVDTSTFYRNIVKGHLEGSGFAIAGLAGSASEASQLLAQSQIKIRFAMVDIDQTDGGNGQAVHLMAQMTPGLVFILTSTRFTPEHLAQNENPAGAYFFLPKPFKKENVLGILKKAYDREIAKKKKPKTEAPPKGTAG